MTKQRFQPGDKVLVATEGADSETWFTVRFLTGAGMILSWVQCGLSIKGSAVYLKKSQYKRIKSHQSRSI